MESRKQGLGLGSSWSMGTMSQFGKVTELWQWMVTESAQCAQHNRAVHNHKDVILMSCHFTRGRTN